MDFWDSFGVDVQFAVDNDDSSFEDSSSEFSTEVTTSWDLANFEKRVGGSQEWDVSCLDDKPTTRVQDLSLNLSIDDGKLHNDDRCRPEKQHNSWPFENSPCRMFGSTNTREHGDSSHANKTRFMPLFGNRGVKSSTGSPLKAIAETVGKSTQPLASEPLCGTTRKPIEPDRSRDASHPFPRPPRPSVVGASKSYDKRDLSSPGRCSPLPHRPGVNRAMSIEPVMPPESQAKLSGQRDIPLEVTPRRGRRKPSQNGLECSASVPKEFRPLSKLLSGGETICAKDFLHAENRQMLHHLIYQSHMLISFESVNKAISQKVAANATEHPDVFEI